MNKIKTPLLLLFDSKRKKWLTFENPLRIISTADISKVPGCLLELEEYLNNNLYAAGFISYEASPAFDDSIQVKSGSWFPLIWFGIYNKTAEFNQLDIQKNSYETSDWQASIDQNRYGNDFDKIKEFIANGDTYQVNYTYRLYSKFSGSPSAFFLDLLKNQPTNYGAYLDIGDFVICSVSPELFFLLDGDSLISKPMKGTTSRGRDSDEDKKKAEWLYYSKKNRAENVMIVDMVRNDFGRVAEYGSITAPHLFKVKKYPTVWQMTSTVTATSSVPIRSIFSALFPAASITGAPKIRTMQIISELETTPRNIYTGCIGFIAPNRKAQFNVAIRTALLNRATSTIEYGIGGGIVWDSIEDEEFTESKMKAKVLFEKRTNFQLIETILWEPETGYFLFDYHISRIQKSAVYFDFLFRKTIFKAKLVEIKKHFSSNPQKIRLLLSQNGNLEWESYNIEDSVHKNQIKLRLAKTNISSCDRFLFHKTTNRKLYENAIKPFSDCDDVILWNENYEITETTIANIVLQFGKRFYTPPIKCGLLAGTFRAYLLERGKLSEKVLTIDDLKSCDTIFTINSVRKWRKAVLIY